MDTHVSVPADVTAIQTKTGGEVAGDVSTAGATSRGAGWTIKSCLTLLTVTEASGLVAGYLHAVDRNTVCAAVKNTFVSVRSRFAYLANTSLLVTYMASFCAVLIAFRTVIIRFAFM